LLGVPYRLRGCRAKPFARHSSRRSLLTPRRSRHCWRLGWRRSCARHARTSGHLSLLKASRFVVLCEALETTGEDVAFAAFERPFAERGLPNANAPTTAFLFPARMPCSISRSFRCGGSGSAFGSSVSSRAIRSRTDATSAQPPLPYEKPEWQHNPSGGLLGARSETGSI
jgi:hypothetical protein